VLVAFAAGSTGGQKPDPFPNGTRVLPSRRCSLRVIPQ
jgi:hypothetical protein